MCLLQWLRGTDSGCIFGTTFRALVGGFVRLSMYAHSNNSSAVVVCSGRIVFGEESEQFRWMIQNLLTDHERVEVDFENVSMIDCAGLGALATCLRHSQACERQLLVVKAPKFIRTLLEMTCLNSKLGVSSVHAAAKNAVCAA